MASKKGKVTESQKSAVDTSSQYAELSKLQQIQDYEKAAKLCNKILNVAPSDGTAFHCKMVCLLQMAKFQEVLKQLSDPGNRKFEHLDMSFEEAYCHYRLNEASKALDVLDRQHETSKQESTRHKELRAQILYRMERFTECFDIYRDIIKNSISDDFEEERMTNLAAVSANLEYGDETQDAFPSSDINSYEMVYNRACYHLAAGKWSEACNDLKKSEKMCKDASREENEEEEDAGGDQEETGIIRVQLAYALQMQDSGYDREAQAIYNSVLKSKPSDIGLIAVASNNMLCLNKDQNIFDSKKRIKAATVDGLEHKLTSKHQAAIARNNALLAMYTNQVDLCKSLANVLHENDTISNEEMVHINAGVLSRAGKTKEAVGLLLELYTSGSKDEVEPVLIAAQILLEKGEVNDAIKVLEENIPLEFKFGAGVLSALVTLCLAVERRPKAAQLLKEAVVSMKKGSAKNRSCNMSMIWRKTAEFHLKGDEPSVASQSLEELLKVDPNNVQTLAQLVLAYAKYDLKKALEVSKKLPKFTEQSKIDVNVLESSSFVSAKYGKKTPKPGDPVTPKTSAESPIEADEGAKKKKKRKHKKKLPKSYDSNVDPDPERWVPRRERTGYRRTRKERRKGEKFTGAQGTSAGQQETYDYSQKKAATEGAIKKQKSPEPEPPVGPRQQRGKPQPKKKKGKKQF